MLAKENIWTANKSEENPKIILNRKGVVTDWEKCIPRTLGCAVGRIPSGSSCLIAVMLLRLIWFMGEKRGVVPRGCWCPVLGAAGPLGICFITTIFPWSPTGQSWKQCAPGHFLYGDFREKQNWKTSSNTQVVLFAFSPSPPLVFYFIEELVKNPLHRKVIQMIGSHCWSALSSSQLS